MQNKQIRIQLIAVIVLSLATGRIMMLILTPTVPTVKGAQIVTAAAAMPEINITKKKVNASSKFGEYTLYQVTMFKYIAVEGIILEEYKCDAGYRTFGIGCVIDTPEEEVMVAEGFTYEEAKKHLEREHLKMVHRIEKDAPNKYNLQQKYALSMLFLSTGYERFWKKNLKFKAGYLAGKGIPENRWIRMCHYKKPNGQIVKSKHLEKSKRFEIALFNNDLDTLLPLVEEYKQAAIKHQKKLGVWRT